MENDGKTLNVAFFFPGRNQSLKRSNIFNKMRKIAWFFNKEFRLFDQTNILFCGNLNGISMWECCFNCSNVCDLHLYKVFSMEYFSIFFYKCSLDKTKTFDNSCNKMLSLQEIIAVTEFTAVNLCKNEWFFYVIMRTNSCDCFKFLLLSVFWTFFLFFQSQTESFRALVPSQYNFDMASFPCEQFKNWKLKSFSKFLKNPTNSNNFLKSPARFWFCNRTCSSHFGKALAVFFS